MGSSGPLSPMKFFFWFLPGNTGLGKKGGAILRAQQKKDFGTIPYYLEIAEEVYVELK